MGASEFLTDAPEGLKAALEKLPQDKYVFTNCNEKEAEVWCSAVIRIVPYVLTGLVSYRPSILRYIVLRSPCMFCSLFEAQARANE